MVEGRIVSHQRRVADERQHLVHDVGEARFVLEESAVRPCTATASGDTSHSGLR
jgi:hypothetical protein